MDVPSEELLRREDVMKQFDVFFENTTNTLNNFVDKIGWSLDETPTNVTIQYLIDFLYFNWFFLCT